MIMCELFAMSACHPTDVNHSLALLRPRGGEIGPHADGWGVSFYEGRAARTFKEPIPAAESRCLAFITEYNFQSTMVLAHIRKANPSQIGRASANTHPFERELNGRSWVFAHNGKLPGLLGNPAFAVRRFHPLGETDSEFAFCLLLDALADSVGMGGNRLSPDQIINTIRPLVEKLAGMGEFNFILCNGQHMIAHAHTNLHILQRACTKEGCAQQVALIATSPLTSEPWVQLQNDRIYVYAQGQETFLGARIAKVNLSASESGVPEQNGDGFPVGHGEYKAP